MAKGGTNVEVEGLDQLADRMDGFVDNLMGQFRDDIGPKVAQMMHQVAVSRVPVRTGNLRQSIHEFDHRIGIDEYDMGITNDARQHGVSTVVHYAPYVEFGTGNKGDPAVMHKPLDHWYSYNPDFDPALPEGPKNRRFILWRAQAPQPFMRPALEHTRKRVVKLMAEGVEAAFR